MLQVFHGDVVIQVTTIDPLSLKGGVILSDGGEFKLGGSVLEDPLLHVGGNDIGGPVSI